MVNNSGEIEILPPKKQLSLFGYENYFKSFTKLSLKNKLPNTILLSGKKGSGKATFAYHFINYLLSINEKNKYSLESFKINPDNKSYIDLCDNIHPNFFLVDILKGKKKIDINQIRKMILYTNTTSFNLNKKVVLISNDTINKVIYIIQRCIFYYANRCSIPRIIFILR